MSERPSEFLALARNTKEDFGTAILAGCNDGGHKSMGNAGVRTVDMLVIMHSDMKDGFAEMRNIPEETVAKLRNEVITLVDSHAEDAVIRQLARRVPPSAPGSATTPAEDRRRIPAGVWAVTAAMGRTAPWAVAATAMCVTTGWIGWLVAKGRGWL
jgi:hypothetical protein